MDDLRIAAVRHLGRREQALRFPLRRIGQQSAAAFSNSRAARGNGLALSISGNRPTGNVFLVDGLVVNDFANASPGSGLNVNLGVEAVREFRVLTSEYTAEYGRSTGGVVTAVLKSGTNEFHGTMFEFLRNSALDARNFFDTERPDFRRNQYGGSAGGPIKRNKTFVFADYEELRENKGIPHTADTLSPDARNGLSASESAATRADRGRASRSRHRSGLIWRSSRSRTARSPAIPPNITSPASASASNATPSARSIRTSPIARRCGAACSWTTPTSRNPIRTT